MQVEDAQGDNGGHQWDEGYQRGEHHEAPITPKHDVSITATTSTVAWGHTSAGASSRRRGLDLVSQRRRRTSIPAAGRHDGQQGRPEADGPNVTTRAEVRPDTAVAKLHSRKNTPTVGSK